MIPRQMLKEYTPTSVELSVDDVEYLQRHMASMITVSPGASPGQFVVNSQQYVGVVRLPSGRIFDLMPKVPLYTFLWMLAEIQRLESMDLKRLELHAAINPFASVLEPIAAVFAEQVEDLLQRGLHRQYVDLEANLVAVRGRIDFTQNLNHNLILKHRNWCRFTELSWDVPENQVIRQVGHMLAGWDFSENLRARLMALDRQMDDITRSHKRAYDIDRFHYSRQSEHYRSVHRFCRLFLEGFSLSEDAGDVPFDGFMIDMNVLFERFVALRLHQYFQESSRMWRLQRQESTHLDVDLRVAIKPDVVLNYGDQPRVVADTKYKRLKLDKYQHADLYQMLAYCTVLDVPAGVLIFPKDEIEHREPILVRNSHVRLHEVAIDLSQSPQHIDDEIKNLAQLMMQLGLPKVSAIA